MQIGHYNAALLFTIVIGLYFGLSFVLRRFIDQKNWYYLPSLFSIITLFFFAVDNSLWKYPPVNPYLNDMPNMEGRYSGYVYFNHLENSLVKDSVNVAVEIKQTGSKVFFHLYSPKGSHSRSISSEIVKDGDMWKIYSVYSNENTHGLHSANRYYGAVIATLNQTEKEIIGHFFNDETRKTYGNLHVKYKSEKLLNRF